MKKWDDLSEEHKREYLAAATVKEVESDAEDDEQVVEKSHRCTCSDREVNHQLLALSSRGLHIGTCITMHGRQEMYAAVTKLTLVYDLAAETLTASCRIDYMS